MEYEKFSKIANTGYTQSILTIKFIIYNFEKFKITRIFTVVGIARKNSAYSLEKRLRSSFI